MSTTPQDIFSTGVSTCCGAKVIDPSQSGTEGICSDCKEHCGIEVALDENDEDFDLPLEPEDDPLREIERENVRAALS